MYYAIYAILDQRGDPVYVGSTNNVKRRMKEHRRVRGEKPSYRILEEGYVGRFLAEEKWIKHYQDMGYLLSNKAQFFGGRSSHSAATRALISAQQKGKIVSEETRLRMSEASRGVPRNWTPEGRRRVEATQFGRRRGAVNEDARRRSLRKHWASLSAEKKSEILRETNLKAWAARSDNERSRIGRKIAATRSLNRTPEELSAIAKKNGDQLLLKNPNIGTIVRDRMKDWWANMTPEYRADYLQKRTARIKAAWELKRQSKLNAKQ